MKSILIGLIVLTLLASCSGDAENVQTKDEAAAAFYSYNEGTTKLEWTAFKTSERIGVPGGFNEVEITGDSSDDPTEVIKSLVFSINTASVETNNEDRNGKIAKHFFESIKTPVITGKVKSLGKNGKAIIEIKMNDVSVDVEGDYTLDDTDFTFKSMIDVASWYAMNGIEALNAICKDLHTGTDGVSKLWSEVELSFSTSLKKTI